VTFRKATDGKLIRHSYSSISKFDTCPFAWAGSYYYKDVKYTEGEAARWGNEVHDSLDKFFKTGQPLKGNLAYLNNYADSIKNSLGEVESEKEIAFDVDWNKVGWWDDQCFQRAKLDIFKKQDERATIIDHKTGKYSPLSLINYNGELEYFTLLAMKNDEDLQKIKTVITWLKGDSKPTVAIYDRSNLNEFEDKFAIKIQNIENAVDNHDFPCKPNGLCNGWCAKTTCKHWKPKRK